MRRRIAGLDLNGRFDVAARDWSPEDPTLRVDPPVTIDGGVAAPVVVVGGEKRPRLIAGPQGILAPHGRGQGWSAIGAADRRRPLSAAIDHLGDDADHAAAVGAAVLALARAATDVVLAVPDLPYFGEAAQGAMIRAAEGPRAGPRRRARLLWRPVAAFLDLLATGRLPDERPGARYRLLVHGPAGLEDQTLTLRDDPEHAGHRAPLREGPGRLIASEIGLDTLFAMASDRVRAANPDLDWRRCEPSRLGAGLLVGTAEAGEAEVLRLHNATWIEARAPRLAPADLALPSARIPPPDRPVAGTFLVTPLAAPLADVLAIALAGDAGDVRIVRAAIVARGALHAGRLIELGLPHYFDRLEPISIAVLRRDGPAFESLIEPDAIVPANREHVSPDLDGFVWGRGKTDAEFYVLKGDAEVRHWEVTHPEAPDRDVPVTLRLRQTPGQSWARLSVTSRGWVPLERSPIDLDWEGLTPLAMTPAEVLETLRSPPPTIPDLLVEHAHVALWQGANWAGDGAIAYLRALHRPATARDWTTLLHRSRREPRSRQKFWMIGTDGSLPTGLDPEFALMLDRALADFAADLLSATAHNRPSNNDLTRALTWSFRRCPEAVQDRLVAALEAQLARVPDPILAPTAALTVVTQGAGRVVSGSERLARMLRVIAQRSANNDTINALAMILTRREEAPAALSRTLVDHFAVALGAELRRQVDRRTFALKFRNTLSALAGLFRWRVREPYALLADREPVAGRLRATLVATEGTLSTSAYRNVRQVEQKREQIRKIVEYLDGGGDPDILRMIEQDDDDDEDEQTQSPR